MNRSLAQDDADARATDGTVDMANGWVAFFDRLEESSLQRAQSALYVRSLIAEVAVHRDQRVLDFGCGFGSAVALLAPLVAEVWWWDPSPSMRSATLRKTRHLENARPYDLSALPPLEPRKGSGPSGGAFDLILVNSVVQYMPPAEMWRWIERFRELLALRGQIVLSDLIPPDHSTLADLLDLLRFGARQGSLPAVLTAALGDVRAYRRTRRAAPLERVGVSDLIRRASDLGLEATALPRNLTHLRKRWTAVLRRPA
jgi:SAM-dependent methyltransferase